MTTKHTVQLSNDIMPNIASIIGGNNGRLLKEVPQQELHLQQQGLRVNRVSMVESARCLDAKENHKVVVKEKGKLGQKYMSLTEPLWTKSFYKSDNSHREQSGDQLCLGDQLKSHQQLSSDKFQPELAFLDQWDEF